MYKCQACYGVSDAVKMSRYRNENDSLYVKAKQGLNRLEFFKIPQKNTAQQFFAIR